MTYAKYSVREIIEKISLNEVYLPAIQRKFVWGPDQIESLFDSIMRGYPIGTFLFWFVRGKHKDDYTFYKFVQEYHDRDNYLNEIAPKPELKEEIIGVLDGQQRLSSMFLALQGTYAFKKPYARRDSPHAYPKRKFYLNLLNAKGEEQNGQIFEFRFLEDGDASEIDPQHLWFLVRETLRWGKDPRIDEYYDDLLASSEMSPEVKKALESQRNEIKRNLRRLHQRLVIEELINYFKVEEQDLDKILDIFVRVNSGGTILSKSDLLFSTIVAHWQDARSRIEDLIERLNGKGSGFRFDTDYVMRACLVLTDCPVLFRVKTFKKSNIERIRGAWPQIKRALERTTDLLIEFGFNSDNLTSLNAAIPIAYHLVKGGKADRKSKTELRKFLIHSLLKRVYGAQTDRVLAGIRDSLRSEKDGENRLRHASFDFPRIAETARLPGSATLKLLPEELDVLLEERKGSYTFMVLSLLYPHLKLGQVKFHQDHIHPASSFEDDRLAEYDIPRETWTDLQRMKDQLPNLQLLEGTENESKNSLPFQDWLDAVDEDGNPYVPDREKFLRTNYIPAEVSLDIQDFEAFFERRRNLLKRQIERRLLVVSPDAQAA